MNCPTLYDISEDIVNGKFAQHVDSLFIPSFFIKMLF